MAKHLQLNSNVVHPPTSNEVGLYATVGNLPTTGVAGKLYVVTADGGSMYQWAGSAYAPISDSETGWRAREVIALLETRNG